ncbi:MAG: FixH family protein [Alphaproteobacteria bacterium]
MPSLATPLPDRMEPPCAAGQPEARRGRWIPWAFVGFFAVVFAVNGVMLTFALGTFNGLSVDGAYDRGLAYNETLAEYEAERALGWHLSVDIEQDAGGVGDLMVTAVDRAGVPLTGATMTASLLRPTQDGFDQVLPLAETAVGVYGRRVTLPLPGQWVVRIDAVRDEDSFRVERRMTLR